MKKYSDSELKALISNAEKLFDFDDCFGICPHCGHDMIVVAPATYNAQKVQINTRAYCCGNYIKLTPIHSIRIESSDVEEDDYRS